jgi:hypothetical protein
MEGLREGGEREMSLELNPYAQRLIAQMAVVRGNDVPKVELESQIVSDGKFFYVRCAFLKRDFPWFWKKKLKWIAANCPSGDPYGEFPTAVYEFDSLEDAICFCKKHEAVGIKNTWSWGCRSWANFIREEKSDG